MSTNTTYMSLKKSQTTDNSTTYLDTDLAGSLDTIDSHDHSTNAKGLAVGRIQTSSTPTVSGGVQVDTTNKDLVIYDGTAARTMRVGVWTDFTPALTQGGSSVAITINVARYTILGKTAIVNLDIAITASGSGAIKVTTVPSAIQPKNVSVVGFRASCGMGEMIASSVYSHFVLHADTTTTWALGFTGSNPALSNGDGFSAFLAYEIA